MTPVQIVLLFVILLLTTLITIISLQLFSLLKKADQTLTHANNILTRFDSLTHNFTSTSQNLTQLANGLNSGLEVAKTVIDLFKSRHHHESSR